MCQSPECVQEGCTVGPAFGNHLAQPIALRACNGPNSSLIARRRHTSRAGPWPPSLARRESIKNAPSKGVELCRGGRRAPVPSSGGGQPPPCLRLSFEPRRPSGPATGLCLLGITMNKVSGFLEGDNVRLWAVSCAVLLQAHGGWCQQRGAALDDLPRDERRRTRPGSSFFVKHLRWSAHQCHSQGC
jgi:hypothetical protein